MLARRTPPPPAVRQARVQAQLVAAAKQRSDSDSRAAQEALDTASGAIGDLGENYVDLDERVRNIEEQLQ